MSKKTIKKEKKTEIRAWAFLDIDEQRLLPPDTCPMFSSLWQAQLEKRTYGVYYSNTKIVPVIISLSK